MLPHRFMRVRGHSNQGLDNKSRLGYELWPVTETVKQILEICRIDHGVIWELTKAKFLRGAVNYIIYLWSREINIESGLKNRITETNGCQLHIWYSVQFKYPQTLW